MKRRRYGLDGDTSPNAIDPASGFKVKLSTLKKAWDGEMVSERFIDKRNPQDFVKGVRDNMKLPFARPEPADQYVALPIQWEDGSLMYAENGDIILSEGIDPSSTL